MTARRSQFCWYTRELGWPGRGAAYRPAWRAGVADASHVTAFLRARAAMYPEAAHLERLLTSNEPAALQRPRVRAYG